MDVDVEQGVGMVVTPVPIGALIVGLQAFKIDMLATTLLEPHVIGAIFAVVPMVVISVVAVVILTFLPITMAHADWQQTCLATA